MGNEGFKLLFGSGDLKKQTEKDRRKDQVKKDVEEFKSIIPDKEREALLKLRDATDALVTAHNEFAENGLKSAFCDASSFQRIHYLQYTDLMKKSVDGVAHIMAFLDNSISASAIAEAVADMNTTYEELERRMRMMRMIESFFED